MRDRVDLEGFGDVVEVELGWGAFGEEDTRGNKGEM